MIAYDFEYFRPASVGEAVRLYRQAEARGQSPLYYAGGSEIISMARLEQLRTGAVIDIKAIPDCCVMEFRGDRLVIGAAVPLIAVEEHPLFPLLADTTRDVADHTNRNRITVGGNLCGKFYYREVLLPFLLVDGEAVLAGPGGTRTVPVADILNGEPRLAPGELLVQVISDRRYFGLPYVTVKKTKMERIDYPVVRIAALKTGEGIRIAFSGVSDIPFRSARLEAILNDASLPMEDRIDRAIAEWPAPILSDILASGAYRTFVLRNTLRDTMAELERRGI
ncbi:FAD binding domain-containing protein [Paenibacillus sp. MWE-103]|uniref:FAD binding domain-containing protein n=1 Tax=Paenibacillus artemisiicola TaxID=1172618 RepID=A0ABS3WGA4_9BACL|nr:FAD binding domain-containing protein [Paenibacillus artemisiicola]MBO7747323.1 FAD binding domain-containing protein [Paenibacillus artemisiicola]